MKIKIIEYNDNYYPNKLKAISNPPKKLYYIGNIKLLDKPSIGIIGTRNISEYGKKYGQKFSEELAKKLVIVSGMAKGVDGVAHRSALNINCETIAVLGSGIDVIYPKENEELYYEIINKNGLVLSEYPPGTEAKSTNFPKRNRIVSALSDSILVIEAPLRSGTSITAKLAKTQGKKVFVLPGSLGNKNSVGSNNLIKEGATLVTNVSEILKYYPQIIEKKWKKDNERTNIKAQYLEIYNLLKNKSYSLEEILIKIPNKSIVEISNLLTLMEIEGIIEKNVGEGYKLKE